jgi:hypothetical protein
MADIIFSFPWRCDDRNCAQAWHKSSYWVDETSDTGYTVDNYSDGDHEEVSQPDLPTDDQVRLAWLEYAEHVLSTGKDPLEDYLVSRSTPVKARWKFMFSEAGSKIVLVEARHGNDRFSPPRFGELPRGVLDYLDLDVETGVILKSSADPMPDPGIKIGRWMSETIQYKEPRPEEAVAADLKAAARRHLVANRGWLMQKRGIVKRKHWDPRERES